MLNLQRLLRILDAFKVQEPEPARTARGNVAHDDAVADGAPAGKVGAEGFYWKREEGVLEDEEEGEK